MEKLKKYLTSHLYIAVGIYIVTLAVVYIVQYPMYAGAVATVFFYLLIYPPMFLVAYLVFRRRGKRREVRNEARRIKAMGAVAVALFAGCVFVAYSILSAGGQQRLATWQIISIVIGLAIIIMSEKRLAERAFKEKAAAKKNITGEIDTGGAGLEMPHFRIRVNYFSLVFSLLLFTTVLFLLITCPNTISDARKILEESGRDDLTFAGHHPPETETLSNGAGALGAYAFSDIDGEEICVDVVSGKILDWLSQ